MNYTKCTSIVLRFSLNQFIEILFILILIFPPCDFGSFHCYILKLPNLLFFGNHLSSLFFFSKHVKNSIHCAFISDRIFFKHSSSLLLKYVKYSFNKYFISLFTISIIHCGSYFFPNFNFHLLCANSTKWCMNWILATLLSIFNLVILMYITAESYIPVNNRKHDFRRNYFVDGFEIPYALIAPCFLKAKVCVCKSNTM